MLIIDPTAADYVDNDDDDGRGGKNMARKKKLKGGKGGRKDRVEKGGKKKKGDDSNDPKGGKKKKDLEDGKGKKGKGGKDGDKRDKKGKKSDASSDKEGGKRGKGSRTPQDDSAVAADERRTREEEERKRREAEDREEEKERQRRARDMKMAMEAELAAEREREAAEAKAGGDGDSSADGRTNRNRLYANEDEALEAEMNALRRKARNASRGSGKSALSRSSSNAEGDLADSRAELAERRRREMDEKLTWMTSQLGLSRQSCRFELPMDMRLLETMTPREYLSKYCVISSKRMLLYKRVFGKFVGKGHQQQQSELRYDDVAAALREVHIHGITEEQMRGIMRLVEMEAENMTSENNMGRAGSRGGSGKTDRTDIDFDFFAGIAALTERIMFPLFSDVKVTPRASLEEGPLEETQSSVTFGIKEKLEKADFFCMPWKFDGINVNPSVKKLLEVL